MTRYGVGRKLRAMAALVAVVLAGALALAGCGGSPQRPLSVSFAELVNNPDRFDSIRVTLPGCIVRSQVTSRSRLVMVKPLIITYDYYGYYQLYADDSHTGRSVWVLYVTSDAGSQLADGCYQFTGTWTGLADPSMTLTLD